jgi:hypothetical protein
MASAKRLLSTRKAITGLLAVAALGLTASLALAKPHKLVSNSHTIHGAIDFSSVDTSECVNPLFSQPFLSSGDSNNYVLVSGESVDNFDGTGWTLSGGASIVTSRLADGSTGGVLDMPGGSQAVSPIMCVQSNYPTARTQILGATGVFFYVSYAGTSSWNNPKNTGQVHGNNQGWALSDPVNMQPYNYTDWMLVRITLRQNSAPSSDTKISNFYVDPYAKR